MQHYVHADEETVLLLNRTGPWGLTYGNEKDDPRKTSSGVGSLDIASSLKRGKTNQSFGGGSGSKTRVPPSLRPTVQSER